MDYGHGHPHVQTPNLDKPLEGLLYERGYVTAPLCRPSLASLVSGIYQTASAATTLLCRGGSSKKKCMSGTKH